MEIQKILWASDGSKESEEALKYVDLFANKYSSEIIGLSVIQPVDLDRLKVPSEVKRELFSIQTIVIEELCAMALKELRFYIDRIPEEKIKGTKIHEKVTLFLRAWFAIVNFAEEEGIDLIVMTTHGRKGFSRFILGSVAEKVISESPCPVLAIKPGISD